MALPALHQKLLRDLVRLAGPAFAVALVVASGIMAYVTMRGAYLSIDFARDRFYARSHFADVFARVVRAPLSVAHDVERMSDVDAVEARVGEDAVLDVPGFIEPVRGRLLSLPDRLNRLTIRQGRLPEAHHANETVVSEAFALAHGLEPGATLGVVVGGSRRVLLIVGTAASPEFVYTIPPGSMWPDDKRYGVLWMAHDALAASLNDTGAFNDLIVKLRPGANAAAFLHDLDRELERWGGVKAVGREEQISHRFVSEELGQLERQTFAVPLIFLGVAVLILHMVLVRLVESQREIVGLLKAVGYQNRDLVLHYTSLSLVIVLMGALLGIAGGVALGGPMIDLYRTYFRFDELHFSLQPRALVVALAMSGGAGVFGAVFASQRVLHLQPAAAMQPPAPPAFSTGLLERLSVFAWLSSSWRMIIRQLLRRPGRSALTVLGMAFAGGIIVVASVLEDAVRYLVDLTFLQTQREDVELVLSAPRRRHEVEQSVLRLPGVLHIEATRAVPVRLRNGPRAWDGALEGRQGNADTSALRLQLDVDARVLPPLPEDGVVLTDELARRLEVKPGEEVLVERLDQDRRVVKARVTGLSRDLLGLHAAGRLTVLEQMFPEGDVATGALALVEAGQQDALAARVKELPLVAGVSFRKAALETFQRLMTESYSITRLFLAFFSSIIAVGIVYNSSRIALAERQRELATLRVLGLTRREVSRIFLGEQLVLVAIAIPCGWLLGRGLSSLLIWSMASSDMFRFPIVSVPSTYLSASAVVAVAAVVTALFARRRLDRLDLVAVLKARE